MPDENQMQDTFLLVLTPGDAVVGGSADNDDPESEQSGVELVDLADSLDG